MTLIFVSYAELWWYEISNGQQKSIKPPSGFFPFIVLDELLFISTLRHLQHINVLKVLTCEIFVRGHLIVLLRIHRQGHIFVWASPSALVISWYRPSKKQQEVGEGHDSYVFSWADGGLQRPYLIKTLTSHQMLLLTALPDPSRSYWEDMKLRQTDGSTALLEYATRFRLRFCIYLYEFWWDALQLTLILSKPYVPGLFHNRCIQPHWVQWFFIYWWVLLPWLAVSHSNFEDAFWVSPLFFHYLICAISFDATQSQRWSLGSTLVSIEIGFQNVLDDEDVSVRWKECDLKYWLTEQVLSLCADFEVPCIPHVSVAF